MGCDQPQFVEADGDLNSPDFAISPPTKIYKALARFVETHLED
jgi:hypothetical protein